MMMASQSPVAARAANSLRRSWLTSSRPAMSTLAAGYSCSVSEQNCWSMWLGTTTAGLATRPSRRISITDMTMLAVL